MGLGKISVCLKGERVVAAVPFKQMIAYARSMKTGTDPSTVSALLMSMSYEQVEEHGGFWMLLRENNAVYIPPFHVIAEFNVLEGSDVIQWLTIPLSTAQHFPMVYNSVP